MAGPEKEIEDLRATVARYFPVYEVRVRPDMLTFFVHIDQATLDKNFDELRKNLIPRHYIPIITKDQGEFVVLLQRRPQVRTLGMRVNLMLLGLTILTTVFAGMVNWAGYEDLSITDPRSVAYGALFFAMPLMLILGIHEMGHYITARRYNVAASLPFFIPSIPPLGTFGALISMRDPIPDRKALVDIGVSGPLYGLVVAIPVTIIGLLLMGQNPQVASSAAGGTLAQPSLLYLGLTSLIPLPGNIKFHPMAFAGWVGMFVTALNLLPAGQLDGGHVARAVLGDRARYLSYFALATMFFLGLFYTGWFIIGLFILFLGARHPPPLNDLTKLSAGRKAIGAIALAVFLVTFIPQPLTLVESNPSFEFVAPEPFYVNVTNQSVTTAYFTIANDGNLVANITVNVELLDIQNVDLNVTILNYSGDGGNASVNGPKFTLTLDVDRSVNVTFLVNATRYSGRIYNVTSGKPIWTFNVKGAMVDGPTVNMPVGIRVTT